MAALSGSLSLILAWTLLSEPLWGAVLEGPCSQQLRYRQTPSGTGGDWALTGILLSCAIGLCIFYALTYLDRRRTNRCAEESKVLWEDCEETGQKGEVNVMTRGSKPLACSQPKCESCSPECSQVQHAYAKQLACMEQELEGFLCEVRSRRSTLQNIPVTEERPKDEEWDSDKLRIVVYEIADCEGSSQPPSPQRRRRKRK